MSKLCIRNPVFNAYQTFLLLYFVLEHRFKVIPIHSSNIYDLSMTHKTRPI